LLQNIASAAANNNNSNNAALKAIIYELFLSLFLTASSSIVKLSDFIELVKLVVTPIASTTTSTPAATAAASTEDAMELVTPAQQQQQQQVQSNNSILVEIIALLDLQYSSDTATLDILATVINELAVRVLYNFFYNHYLKTIIFITNNYVYIY